MYDCIVIGRGPAACTAATLIAMARFKTLLLEDDTPWRWSAPGAFAREAVGTLRRLGMPDHVCAEVPGDFDVQLLRNAAGKGVERRPASRAGEVLFHHGPSVVPRAIGVRLFSPDGTTDDVAGRVILETNPSRPASSNPTSGTRYAGPAPAHAALWAYYQGARREPGVGEEGALVVPTRHRRSWFWFVPLPEGATSVGVVFEADRLAGRDSPESVLEEELCDCPAVLERLMEAELASEFHVLREVPPLVPRVVGDGWLVLGDAPGRREAAGLSQPACECGLFLALKAGELTADCICDALAVGDTSGSQLGKWEVALGG